ncbi:hypothetical protein [Pseudactinotalea suaedae]|uniref:hypothetical protein n=1 Tax=Pseudactinotalea suaedae TaxID=1524924 RepID=UPI0012E2D066|nr:hypothetical protein [Pseudactinotalea suaedae]
MSVFRRAAATAAALVATIAIAPAATAATQPPEPSCSTASTAVTWTTRYDAGRYELSTLVLSGLEACAGVDLVVAVGSEQHLYAEVPVTVTSGPLTVDVSEHRIPAAQVERLALTLRSAVPTTPNPASPTSPTAPVAPAEPGSTGAVSGSHQVGGSIDTAGPAGTALPITGTNAAWFAALAAALVVLGAALRHRTRQETHRA